MEVWAGVEIELVLKKFEDGINYSIYLFDEGDIRSCMRWIQTCGAAVSVADKLTCAY